MPSYLPESQSWDQGIPFLFSIQVAAQDIVSTPDCSSEAPWSSTSCVHSRLQQWGCLVEHILYLFQVAAGGGFLVQGIVYLFLVAVAGLLGIELQRMMEKTMDS